MKKYEYIRLFEVHYNTPSGAQSAIDKLNNFGKIGFKVISNNSDEYVFDVLLEKEYKNEIPVSNEK